MVFVLFASASNVMLISDLSFVRIGWLTIAIEFSCTIPFLLNKKKEKRAQSKSSSSFSGFSSPVPMSSTILQVQQNHLQQYK